MTVRAVEGGAGCGKTFRLMEMLTETLVAHPLMEGQRVLALTFMHGARRRLADRLRAVPGLLGRVECCTVDSFAWRIYRRWRGLAAALGIPAQSEGEFDAVCDAAGMLLEHAQVRSWTAASFPIVLVDEGQDLRPQRLRMLVALSTATRTLIAADEFQCLDQTFGQTRSWHGCKVQRSLKRWFKFVGPTWEAFSRPRRRSEAERHRSMVRGSESCSRA